MRYEVLLENIDNNIEVFEENGDNTAEVMVLKDGCNISQNCRVQITLTKNAMLGLGTELIRLSHNFKEGKHSHVDPVTKDNVCQSMGIFLKPQSAELIVCCAELGEIDKYIPD